MAESEDTGLARPACSQTPPLGEAHRLGRAQQAPCTNAKATSRARGLPGKFPADACVAPVPFTRQAAPCQRADGRRTTECDRGAPVTGRQDIYERLKSGPM